MFRSNSNKLTTTPGPNITEMWYREFLISENTGVKGLYYIFQGIAFKKYVRLQQVDSAQPQPQQQTEKQDRYIFRTLDKGQSGLYHLMYIKTKTQKNPHFHLCGISFKNNTADFIHFRITSKKRVAVELLEYIDMPEILQEKHTAELEDRQYEFIGEPTQEWKPIFSETRLKDAIGLFLKFLIIFFGVDNQTISLLKSGETADETYNFVITDIDEDIGQKVNIGFGNMSGDKLNSIFNSSIDTTINITKYLEYLHKLRLNNSSLSEKYGGKRKTIRKKSKKRRTQKSKNRRRQKKR